jgi:dinuclear metal center YbgI/SA1388 family protein
MMAEPVTVALATVAAFLDERLTIAKFDEPDSNGLLLRATDSVTRVAVAVSASYHAIERAAAEHADLLVTHHPSWERFDLEHAAGKRMLLQKSRMSHYAAHSALDGAHGISNSDGLAQAAGVTVERRFLPYCGGLAGVIGRGTGSFDEMVVRLRFNLGTQVDAWKNSERFGVIALAGGRADAPSAISEAKAAGADTYVTGEGSMWTKLYARESGINLVFGTHYGTETFGVRALGELLHEFFSLPWVFIPESEDVR